MDKGFIYTCILYAITAVICCAGLLYTLQTHPDPNKYICTERQYAKVMKRTADCYEDTDLNHVQCYSSAIIALCSEK